MGIPQTALAEIHKSYLSQNFVLLRTGMTVKVHQKIFEANKERIQIFEGIIIKIGSGAGLEKTMMVRKVVDNIGVEKIFPLHSPRIKKIEIVKKAKVRRSKLYFLRNLRGKKSRLKEVFVKIKKGKLEEKKEEVKVAEMDNQEKVESSISVVESPTN